MGIMAGIPTGIVFGVPGLLCVFLLMVPMLFDGFLQLLTPYESGNMRRLLTGLLFGFALVFAFVYFHRACVHVAGWILKQFWDDPAEVDRVMNLFL